MSTATQAAHAPPAMRRIFRVGRRFAARGAIAIALTGCDRAAGAHATQAGTALGGDRSGTDSIVTVVERWISPGDSTWDLDTPAVWRHGTEARVLVTSKHGDDLKVFDAATGRTLTPIGRSGTGLGEFRRPNAVAVVGDVAVVVERDNHRVQLITLPDGRPLGIFGERELVKPYGEVIVGELPELTVWVTDDYDVPADGTGDLTHRVHRFRVRLDEANRPHVVDHATFGAAAANPGALHKVETISIDPPRNRMLVADERSRSYLVYDTAGTFTGAALGDGRVVGDPEGLALVRCPDESGYWIASDQLDTATTFRVYRRDDLSYVGAFRGVATIRTDGVSFAAGSIPGIGGPMLVGSNADRAVSAFAWSDIAKALHLAEGCGT